MIDLVLGVVARAIRVVLSAAVVDYVVSRERWWLGGVTLVVAWAAAGGDALGIGALLVAHGGDGDGGSAHGRQWPEGQ